MIGTLLRVSRPVSWVNTAYPFTAAAVLTGGLPLWVTVVGTIFFLVPYNLAMYGINDVFDYESDLRNPRKGGVEGAVVDRTEHRRVLLASWCSSRQSEIRSSSLAASGELLRLARSRLHGSLTFGGSRR